MKPQTILRKCYRCGKIARFIVQPIEYKEKPHFIHWYCTRCEKWNKDINIGRN